MDHVDTEEARDLRRDSLQMREIGLLRWRRLEISLDSRVALARVCFHLSHSCSFLPYKNIKIRSIFYSKK